MADSTSIPVVLPSRDMTTDEFKRWYARLGLNQSQLAKRLDVDQGRISRWLSGARTPPGYLWRALEHLAAELEQERKPKRRARRPSAGANET